jgi:uncharacterized phiE125 gp8 family phage protein
MFARVITPPDPIMTPADVPGSPSPTDANVAALIASATEEIDGPTGWLGRCIGPQTLELALPCFGWEWLQLMCPPIISITSVTYLDSAGVRQTVAGSTYELIVDRLHLVRGASWPSAAGGVIVTYQAGYNGAGAGKTGVVPARVKQAVKMAVQNMMALGAEDLALRSETVEGVGVQTYMVSDVASNLIQQAAERLLRGLKVYRV